MPLTFEQQPREGNKAFAAFSLYLSLGPERSTQAVAAKLAKSAQLIRRWSARYDWTGRVQAHGAHLAAIERQASEAVAASTGLDWGKVRAAQRLEEYQMHEEALELARTAIERWKANPGRCGSLEGIARLLELASRLGRLASGMPTDRTVVTGEDGGPIRIELTAALNKIYGEPLAGEVVDVEVAPVPPAQLPEKTP
jgi:hypothetical protein